MTVRVDNATKTPSRLSYWHPFALIAAWAFVALPNLGATTLWDDDEGANSECTREMIESGTWIVPTANWDLRTAKPILLNWVMRGSFALFGETEFAARFPSTLFFLMTILLTYDLGRRMFGAVAGLLAGFIALSSFALVYLGRAATPDSALVAFTTLYFWSFWVGSANGGRSWFLPCAAASALAMLTKGPAVGLILPSATAGLILLWNRDFFRLVDRRMIGASLLWALIAAPWYILVTVETKGEWIRAFVFEENLGRASEPRENHRGIPVLYELGTIGALFAPWSAFLFAAILRAFGSWKGRHSPERFLLLWIAVYFFAFAVAQTKLPHYTAPLYPAIALLVARLLSGWMQREFDFPRWVLPVGLFGLTFTGLAILGGFLILGGAIPLDLPKVAKFPGLANWAWLGLIPIVGATAMGRFVLANRRGATIFALVASVILMMIHLAAFTLLKVELQKGVKPLVDESGARQLTREVRVASFEYTKPSLTFYVGRRVERFADPALAAEFLEFPVESYLFTTEANWESRIKLLVKTPVRIAAKHFDFTKNAMVVVIASR